MKNSLLNRKMFFAVLILFVFVFAVQMAEPASAAKWKKFDKGEKFFYSDYDQLISYKWVSYKKGTKYAKVYSWWTNHDSGKKVRINIYFKKMSKKIIRIKTSSNGKTKTQYFRTTWTAARAAKWWIRH
ncbi:hypothetical protein [Methanobacterium alcaliphilum]|uniref:hypothetical protein n=1 Tax=Methanobacterium alcaliphilum TaxID=392018 RepID=UPI00200B75F5|nr:hypothetical protein [Methanobacterium alcaliphilum]MCK9150544.1 hypothetical protein [Methanobacterium alcaliphilum]